MPLTNAFGNLALDASVADLTRKFKPGVRTTVAGVCSTIGDNTLVTPATGKLIRLYWVGLSSSQNNAGENLVVVKFAAGGAAKYRWRMGNPGAFSHWEVLDGGINEALIITLSTADAIDWNITYEEA